MFYEYHYCYFRHKMKFTNSLVSRLSLHCNADSGKLGGAWDKAIHLFLSCQDYPSQQMISLSPGMEHLEQGSLGMSYETAR